MEISKYKKIFGIGPLGALISIIIFLILWLINQKFNIPQVTSNILSTRIISAALIIAGVSLHLWSGATLRAWWLEECLCTKGPFKYFRHPMYSAWITFIVPGVCIYLNSWVFLLLPVILHPIWHMLVRKEEKLIHSCFGDEYEDYKAVTGRFIPRIFSKKS